MSAPYEPLVVRSHVLVLALLSIFGAQPSGWARQEHRPPPPTAQRTPDSRGCDITKLDTRILPLGTTRANDSFGKTLY